MGRRKKDQLVFRGMDQEEQELYEERLFRDSFLKKQEEKNHAFMVTVLALLLLFAGMMLLLYLYVFSGYNGGGTPAPDQTGTQSDIVIIAGQEEGA